MGSGVLLRNDEGQILLVEPTYKNHWELSGGVVDADESPYDAAVRELKEELDAWAASGGALGAAACGP